MSRRRQTRNIRGPTSNFYEQSSSHSNLHDNINNYNNFNPSAYHGSVGMAPSTRPWSVDNTNFDRRPEFSGQRNCRKQQRYYKNQKQQETYNKFNNVNFTNSNQGYYNKANEIGYNDCNEVGYNNSSKADYNNSNNADYNKSSKADYNNSSKADYNNLSKGGYNKSSKAENNNSSRSGCKYTSTADYNKSSKADYNNSSKADYINLNKPDDFNNSSKAGYNKSSKAENNNSSRSGCKYSSTADYNKSSKADYINLNKADDYNNSSKAGYNKSSKAANNNSSKSGCKYSSTADYTNSSKVDYINLNKADDYNNSSKADYNNSSKADYNNSSKAGYNKSSKAENNNSSKPGCKYSSTADYNKSSKADYNNSNKADYNNSSKADYNKSSKADYKNSNEDFNSMPSSSWTDAFWHKQNTTATQISKSTEHNHRKSYNKVEKTLNKMLSQPAEMSKGKSLLEKMGWKGGGLGKDETGIIEPIAPEAAYASQTIGLGTVTEQEENKKYRAPQLYENLSHKLNKFKRKAMWLAHKNQKKLKKWAVASEDGLEEFFKNRKKKFDTEFQTTILLKILEFVQDDTQTELLFEEQSTKLQRKKVHQLVQNIQNIDEAYHFRFELDSEIEIVEQILAHNRFILYTESDGVGVSRRLTLYKEAPEDVFLITPDDLKYDVEEKTKLKNAKNNTKNTKKKFRIKKINMRMAMKKNDASNLVLPVHKENEFNNDSDIKRNTHNEITDTDNKAVNDVNKNNKINIFKSVETTKVDKNKTVDHMKDCKESSKITDKTKVTLVEDKLCDNIERDTKNIHIGNETNLVIDITEESNDDIEISKIIEKKDITECNDFINSEICERNEESTDTAMPETVNIETKNDFNDRHKEINDLKENDCSNESDVIKLEEYNVKLGEPEINNKQKVLTTLIEYLEEFVKNNKFKEFRFLGTFKRDEYEAIQMFFDVISRKDVECEEESKIWAILKHDSYNFDVAEDTNGSYLILKSKKTTKSSEGEL